MTSKQLPSQTKEINENHVPKLMALLFVLGSLVAVFLAFQSSHTTENQTLDQSSLSPDAAKIERLVNKHLFWTNQKIELEQKQRQLENQFNSPRVGEALWPRPTDKFASPLGVDHSPDRNEDRAYQDLNRYPHELTFNSPDSEIQGQITDEQAADSYQEEYKKEYARQFVENARQHGYQVKLSDEYVVVSVMPLRRPNSESKATTSAGSGAE